MLPRRYVISLLAVATLLAGCAGLQKSSDGGFVPLFDGQTFAGWEGNLDVFRIEDGAIVGGSLKQAVAHNDFLCTRQDYGDFELRLQVKLLGEQANAGIQIRTRRVPDHYEVSGYQADMGQQYWGCLYDESRRNKVLAGVEKEQAAYELYASAAGIGIQRHSKGMNMWLYDLWLVEYLVDQIDGGDER